MDIHDDSQAPVDESRRAHSVGIAGWRMAAFVIGLVVLLVGQTNVVAQVESPGVLVRVYDGLGIPIGERLEAGRTARDILSRAGLDVSWWECRLTDAAATVCSSPLGQRDVAVRIVARHPHSLNVLGAALVDGTEDRGTLASVYRNAVAALAERAGSSKGRLLGRVMAHEISHLLLGTRSHTRDGLMRANWSVEEISRDRPDQWVLSSDDATRLHAALTARSMDIQAPSESKQARR